MSKKTRANFIAVERLRKENALLEKQVAWLAGFLDEFCNLGNCGDCRAYNYCPYGYINVGINVSGFADISRKVAEEQP